MKKIVALTAALALALIAPAALAGEGHKCSQEAQTCLDYMATNMQARGWAGVNLEPNDAEQYEVTEVHDGTPAAKAGVKVGDVLLAINGMELYNEENKAALGKLEGQMKPGAKFDYTIQRGGKQKEISLELEAMPEQVRLAMIGRHMVNGHTSMEMAANN